MWFLNEIIFVALLCIFSILSMSRHKSGYQNCTACSRCGQTRDLYNGRIISIFVYLKFRAMNPSTLFVVFAAFFSVCFCHLRSLVMMIPRSSFWSVEGNCWLDMLQLFAYCCVRCASQNIYLHWNSFATCLPTQKVYWYLPVVSIMSSGFLALWQSLISSVNIDISLTILVSRSFICIINSIGPNTYTTLYYTRCDWCPVAIGLCQGDFHIFTSSDANRCWCVASTRTF